MKKSIILILLIGLCHQGYTIELTRAERIKLQEDMRIKARYKKDDGAFLAQAGAAALLIGIVGAAIATGTDWKGFLYPSAFSMVGGLITIGWGGGKYLNGKRIEWRIPDYNEPKDNSGEEEQDDEDEWEKDAKEKQRRASV